MLKYTFSLCIDPRILRDELERALVWDAQDPTLWEQLSNRIFCSVKAFFHHSPYVMEHIKRSGALQSMALPRASL
jgi:hypothetical protein